MLYCIPWFNVIIIENTRWPAISANNQRNYLNLLLLVGPVVLGQLGSYVTHFILRSCFENIEEFLSARGDLKDTRHVTASKVSLALQIARTYSSNLVHSRLYSAGRRTVPRILPYIVDVLAERDSCRSR
jgi:hypothetical protein